MNGIPFLSLITFLPVLGMIIILALPSSKVKEIKYTTLLITGIQLILSVFLLANFNFTSTGIFEQSTFQFVEKFRWIEITGLSWLGTVKVDYFMGVDGLSMPMIILTALISFIATLSSWNINKSIKGYFALFLLLDTGMMGTFVALDFFLFYVFWEIMLLPMYLLIYPHLPL